MRYIELKLRTESENIEKLIAEIMNLGIVSFEVDDPKEIDDIIKNLQETEWYDKEQVSEDFLRKENGDDLATITLYFDEDEEGKKLAESIIGKSRLLDYVSVEYEEKDDSEWKDNWKDYYLPTRVTERIVVAPTWAKEEDIDEVLASPIKGDDSDYDEESDLQKTDCEYNGLEPADIVIRMDPGMAFGTGTHETTALTLMLMERAITEFSHSMNNEESSKSLTEIGIAEGVFDKTCISNAASDDNEGDSSGMESIDIKLLDVGTGSGILAIAAALLGVKDILAIDIDEEAVKVAKENLVFNLGEEYPDENAFEVPAESIFGVSVDNDFGPLAENRLEVPCIERERIKNIKVMLGDLTEGVDYKADIIVANLLTDLIIRFAPDAVRHLDKNGIFISSGILVEHKEKVLKAFGDAGFDVGNSEIEERGEWCAIAVRLRN